MQGLGGQGSGVGSQELCATELKIADTVPPSLLREFSDV